MQSFCPQKWLILSLPFIGVSNSLAFSPFSPKKGMAMISFCHTPHHPCCGTRGASSSLFGRLSRLKYIYPPSLGACLHTHTHTHTAPSFTFYSSAAQRQVQRQRDEALNGQSIIKLASFTGGHACNFQSICLSWSVFSLPSPIPHPSISSMVKTYSCLPACITTLYTII